MQPLFLLNSVTVAIIFVICFEYTQSRAIDLRAAKDYLVRYGYLPKTLNGNELISKESAMSALKSFQKRFGLDATGQLDQRTISLMSKRRCGIPDEDVSIQQGNVWINFMELRNVIKWEKTRLTYEILSYTNQIDKREVDNAIEKAFEVWTDVTNLRIVRKKKYEKEKADINIRFGVGKHDRTEYDSNSFDGLGGTIAHAFFPPDGRLHFDDDEIWKINLKPNSKRDFYGSSDLLSCAIHEIGHILGLKHSTVDGTIMWPLLQNGLHTLHHDDIDSVRALYGFKINGTPRKDKQGCVIETGVYISSGNNVGQLHVENGAEECASQCALTEGCVAWTLDVHQSYCWLKSDDSNKGEAEGWTTGIKECGSSKRYPGFCEFNDCTWKSPRASFQIGSNHLQLPKVKSSAVTLSENVWKSTFRKMVIIRTVLSIVTM